MILPIYVYGQPILRKVAVDITKDYDRIREQNKNAQSQNKFISIVSL